MKNLSYEILAGSWQALSGLKIPSGFFNFFDQFRATASDSTSLNNIDQSLLIFRSQLINGFENFVEPWHPISP